MLLLPINDQLKRLASWQQSVFCIALTQHTILHFHLFCEAVESENGKIIDNINQLFWEKMTVKGAKINFTIQQEHFEAIIPDACDFQFYGVYPAIDHCVIMSCAFNSLLSKSADEAFNASQTAFSTIASFMELQSGKEVDKNELQETSLFQEQLIFQEALLAKLSNQRSPELIKSIRQYVLDFGVTNLGIALSD
ncbi:YjaG family protein [Psychromonas antarctica]|uniref:YjaG family protein n=1 Tax=Psychromonas antarctica TaxID=67573 RepID=UPI001EE7BDF7|nr:YjaG family protein [Psychromonas antarctica]MCG6200173.1 YjaG family protein [Psychromonas antarctica]